MAAKRTTSTSAVRGPAIAAAAALALLLAACGGASTSSTSNGDGLPDTVTLVATQPLTGVVAHVGQSAMKGYELAINEVNDSDFLDSTQLELKSVDTKSETQTAASATSSTLADSGVAGMFGSVASSEAVAQAPMAQRKGMPIVFTQAGSDGVVVGDYTYRATPLMREYFPLLGRFIEEQGWKSVGIIYASFVPTLADIGENAMPKLAEELGLEVTANLSTQATTQDYRPSIKRLLDSDPDGVALFLYAAGNVTAIHQLRQAGYGGPILSTASAGYPVLEPAGDDARDVVWPVDFNHGQSAASSQDFVQLYEDTYDEAPSPYAAEAYDAAWFMAKAIKTANTTDREQIKEAMSTTAEEPFDGALGEGLTWQDGDLRVPGVVVRWNGTGEEVLYEGES